MKRFPLFFVFRALLCNRLKQFYNNRRPHMSMGYKNSGKNTSGARYPTNDVENVNLFFEKEVF